MSLVKMHAIERSGGCGTRKPSAVVPGPQTGKSSRDLGQVERQGTERMSSLSHPPGVGLEQDLRCTG